MGYFLLSLGLLAASLVDFAAATVVFPVTLIWAKGAPDGFEREMIFVNGQMPGPTLNLQQGDDVEVGPMSTSDLYKADSFSLLSPIGSHTARQSIFTELSMRFRSNQVLISMLTFLRQLNTPWSGAKSESHDINQG